MAIKRYEVQILDSAVDEIEAIVCYIAEDSVVNALRWFERTKRRIASLDSMPERCPIARESEDVEQEIRHLVIGDYRVLFAIKGNIVQVLHVRNGAMERKL